MATRVNTRFILILLIAIVGAGGVVGGLYMLQYRKDATRNIRKGDQFAAAGQWDQARGQYGRAVQKQPESAEFVDKLEHATLQVVPASMDQARELYGGYVGVLQHRVQHFGSDPAHHLALLQEHRRAAEVGMVNWRAVADAAEYMLLQFGPEHEAAAEARLYRARARMNMRATLDDDELAEIETDLRDYLAANPTDDEAWALLMEHQATDARAMYLDDLRREARERMAMVEATYQEAQANDAAGPHVAAMWQTYLATRVALGLEVTNEQMIAATEALLEEVVEHLDELDERFVIDAAGRVTIIRDGVDNAIEFLRAWAAANPPAYDARLAIARLESRRQNIEVALDEAATVLADLTAPENQPTTGLDAVLLYRRCANAALASFNIAYDLWDSAPAEKKGEALAALEERIGPVEQYAQIAGVNNIAEIAAGRLAYARGDDREAVALLEGAVDERSDADTIRILAAAHHRLGNTGLAYQHIRDALAKDPNDPRINYDNLRYSLQLRRVAAAEPSLQLLERIAPDDPRIARLRSEYMRLTSGSTGATEATTPAQQALQAVLDHMAAGEYDEARAILLPMLEQENLRAAVLEMLVRVEYAADDREAASEYLTQALEIAPDAPSLQRLRAVLDNDDQIDAMIQFCESTHDDEGRAALAILNNLAAYKRAWTVQRERARQQGDSDTVRELDELIARADAERGPQLARARQHLPEDDAGLFEYEFSSALMENRWDDAEALLAKHNDPANNWNIDGCNGLLFRGRLQLLRGNPEDAITTLLEATQRAPYSPQAWRSLGVAYSEVGNVSESQRAFERAYESNPNNIATALVYVASLVKTGDETRALQILTDLRRLAPRNPQVQSQYLAVLAQSGNEIEAFKERTRIHAENPDDIDNTIQLALLMATVVPSRDLIVDANGRERFTARQWAQMTEPQRQQVIREQRTAWQEGALAMLDEVREKIGTTQRYVNARAALLERIGRPDEAVEFLHNHIESLAAGERTVDMYLTIASLCARLGRHDEALAYLTDAQALETDEDQRATVAKGDVYFQLNRLAEARDAFLAAINRNPARDVQLKLVDTLIRLGEIDAAQERLDTVVTEQGADMTSWMLAANLAARQAVEAEKAGRLSEADFHREQVVNHLNEASRINPRSTAPAMQLARYHYQRFAQTGESRHLDEALRTLDSVDRIDARNEQSRLLRVDVLLAKGDQRGAIGSLRRYVDGNPDNERAREVLISMLGRTGQLRDAEQLIRDAVLRHPESAVWQERLGDHLRATGAPSASIVAAYTAALEIKPTAAVIDKLVLHLVSPGVDDPQQAESILLQHAAMAEDDPLLLMDRAIVEHALERPANARQALQRAYEMIDAAQDNEARQRGLFSRWINVAARVLDSDVGQIETMARNAASDEIDPEVLRGLGKLVVNNNQSDLDTALRYYERAMAGIDAGDETYRASVDFEFGTLHTMAGNTQQAMESFERVLQVLPDHVLALNNYAFLKAEEFGEYQTALDAAERAAKAAPDNSSVRDTLGRVLFHLERYDEAAAELQASLAIAESPTTLVHLAEVEVARGRLEQARDLLNRARQLQPDSRVEADIQRVSDDIEAKGAGS